MARATGGAAVRTRDDGTKVIAANPGLEKATGPVTQDGRFTGKGVAGLKWERRWTTPGVHPYDEITWDLRSAEIKNESGGTVFEQTDVEVPSFWSQLATNVVVSKYFRGHIGTPGRERSVKQLIDRVVNTIAAWAETQRYFATTEDLQTFKAELTHLLVHQKMSFNSPVWFNVGVEEKPQCSACQPYRALVSTPDGMVPIGQLVEEGAIGREVYDANGVTRIVAVKNNGWKPVYRIQLRNGNFVEATPDHVVRAVRERRAQPEWLRVDELAVGMRMHLHPHRAKVNQVAAVAAEAVVGVAAGTGTLTSDIEIDTHLLPDASNRVAAAEAALAGWLQADGFVGQYNHGTNRSLTIEFQVASDDEYAWVTSNLDIALPLVHYKVRDAATKDTHVQRIRLYGEQLREFVVRWDLLKRGTEIRVPSRLWTASYDEICAYLRSIFQADGYVSVRRAANGEEAARVAFAVISEGWVEDVQLLLNSIGIYSRRLRKTEKREDRHDLYEVQIGVGSERARFAELVGFIGKVKQAKLLESLGLRDLKNVPSVREEEIVAIEYVGREEVYDIQTESGEYLSNNVAVHNCFINSVQDNMGSIMDLAKTEAMLFKYGSGAGVNLSPIRGSKEQLSRGGIASGPVSFMKGFDAFAGVVKSGGTTRRAAKMVILDADHPDVVDFIDSKANEEKKAWALIEQGYDPSFTGEAYGSVFFQNANHSVRVTDEFMRAVEQDKDWTTHEVTSGKPADTYKARDLFRKMGDAAWICGDPGIQYDTTINDWNPVSNSARQYATNPCVTGDTLVATDKGWKRIDQLVGKTAAVIGSDGRPHTVTSIFPTGRKQVYELRTVSGYRLRLTADHKVLTTVGDVPANRLTRWHRVQLGMPGFGSRSIDPAVAQVIGLAVGDGMISRSVTKGRLQETVILTMHAQESAVLATAAATVNGQKRLLRAVGLPGRAGDAHVSMSATGSRLAFGSKVVVDTFKKYAVLDKGSHLKRFAEEVFDLDRPSIAALLRGLYTADGTVVDSGAKVQYVGLDSTSLELLVQVQRLLLAFGVKSKLYENRRNGRFTQLLPDGKGGMREYAVREMHSLRVTRSSRVLFEKEIGFAPESLKSLALRKLNERVSTYRDEMVDEVLSITPLGEEDVYDLTEPATSHFVANGIAVHNCSEFSFINDTSCNLASVNLMKFVQDDGEFDIEAYRFACQVTITAQEILVDNAGYPTPLIELNSHLFRPLGLGYANLGALLMSRGLAYDSKEGQAYAATLTSIMTGEAYAQSAVVARDHGGPFKEYKKNEEPFLRVIKKHRSAAYAIPESDAPRELIDAARSSWDKALELGTQHGYRNAQVTVLAPTGCLVGGSLVLTDRGLVRLRSLGNPDGDKWQELDLRVGTDDGPRAATKFFVNGAEPVVNVKTRRGYRIQGTTMHRIKVVDANGDWQWRRFSDVRAGDRVPMMLGGLIGEPREVPLPPLAEAYWTSDHTTFVPRFMSADLAELVGYFMGDGSLHAKGLRFAVDSKDTDVVDRLTDLGRRLFGLNAAVTPRQGYTEVAFKSVRLTLWWEACGFAKKSPTTSHRGKGYESHIPDAVLFSNDPHSYRAFVRGLFEADGNTNNGYAYWSTTSEQFSYDVQSLLLALGFVTTRDTSTRTFGHLGTNAVHRLRLLNAASAGRWLSDVSFISERKREHLAAMASPAPQGARHDLVPVGRATVDLLAPANDSLRKSMLLSLSRTGLISRRAATALLERTQDPELAQSLGYFYDEIASAELGEEQLTYDISVPENVTYVANGFVSHNTIAFMMDCDTTGVEPDIALIKYKKLVGEGFLKIVNKTVPAALKKLGYSPVEVEEIVKYVDERETIEGAPSLKPEHLSVFDCAFKPVNGERSIHYMGHVRMMGAIQPFLSGAISKTVNMPEAATADDIADVYLEGWKLGLKAIAIYRDGSKRSQPLSTGKKKKDKSADTSAQLVAAAAAPMKAELAGEPKPYRRRLPDERRAVTHKFQVSGHEGYITVGLYPDGQPGEIFLKMAKEGSTVSGLMDALATMTSISLQYGVPLRDLVNKFGHVRFEPAGFTGNSEIPIAKSIVDYVFRWMGSRFLSKDERDALGIITRDDAVAVAEAPGGLSEPSAGSASAPLRRPAGADTPVDAVGGHAESPRQSEAPTAAGSSDPLAHPTSDKSDTTTGEVGGPKASAVTADPPPAEAVGGTDLPVHSNGHTNRNGHGEAKLPVKPLNLGGGTKVAFSVSADSPSCADCGSIMVRNGSCYKCLNCGSTSGCS